MISYRNQKSFNVVVIKYKNSLVYVQRQIDRILCDYRRYVRIYVDNIVIFSKFLTNYKKHLTKIFNTFFVNNIFIKSSKTFVEYLSI